MLYSNDPARPTIEERGIRIDEEEPEISVFVTPHVYFTAKTRLFYLISMQKILSHWFHTL